MDAAEEPAHPFERVITINRGHATGTTWEDRKVPALERMQRAAVDFQRRDHRNFRSGEFCREGMFFDDLRVVPAAGAVELDHHRRAVFHTGLVDAVLVAVEREHAAVRHQPDLRQRIEDAVGRQAIVWGVGGCGLAAVVANVHERQPLRPPSNAAALANRPLNGCLAGCAAF